MWFLAILVYLRPHQPHRQPDPGPQRLVRQHPLCVPGSTTHDRRDLCSRTFRRRPRTTDAGYPMIAGHPERTVADSSSAGCRGQVQRLLATVSAAINLSLTLSGVNMTRISRPGTLAAGGTGQVPVRRSIQPQVNDRDRVRIRRIGQSRDPFRQGALAQRRAH
jgi:hypothetical protein